MTTSKRAAIYARFSSDLQRDRSIEDQFKLCEDYCRKEGLAVVARFDDRARSGASVLGRDGLMGLMEAAIAGAIDVVVVEALDRLSRDQEDLAGLYKRLSFKGIVIRAVHDGEADEIQVGIRGLVGALYLKDLAHKVRRGQAGVIRDGRAAGGLTYGYRPVAGRPGERDIVAHEADVVRRIFALYAGGASVRAIVAELNSERIPPPLGRVWMPSTLMGSRQRRNGIIQNEAYGGRLVWNRTRMIKDPDTGKRVSRINPESEWVWQDAPALRIVDDAMFKAAIARRKDVSYAKPHMQRRAKHLLSGLLRCSVCGGGMSVKDRDLGRWRIICTAARVGACSNRRPYRLDKIEELTVAGLKERMRDKDALTYYVKVYNAERQRLAADRIRGRARLEARLVAAQGELDRFIKASIKGRYSDEEADRELPLLRAARDRLRAELAGTDEPPKIVSLHPAALDRYRAAIDRLDAALREGAIGGEEARQALRDMVSTVTVHPPTADNTIHIEVEGHLSHLIGGEAFPKAMLKGGTVVAEARYIHSPLTAKVVEFRFTGTVDVKPGSGRYRLVLAPERDPIKVVG
jgi:site-specific DNA recombinase